tara:strand:- start:290 stop:445 length:156 start_codon:yes stop_codon:yes gene_type:complete
MQETDLKLLLINSTTFLVSFSDLENILKIILLIASIGYTAQRWYYMHKKNG